MSWTGTPGGRSGRDSGRRGFGRPAADPPGTSRLFVAVPVADDVREAVAGLMSDLAGAPIEVRAPGQPRWVSVDGLHLTVRFLGPTPEERVVDLSGALVATAAEEAPFQIELGGGGAFPSPARPRVLWVGVRSGFAELERLSRRLDGELQKLGWPPDDRPLQAHLTLARTDGVPGSDERARRLIELARDMRQSWQARELVLYRSHIGHGPSHYEIVAAAPFGAAAPPAR